MKPLEQFVYMEQIVFKKASCYQKKKKEKKVALALWLMI